MAMRRVVSECSGLRLVPLSSLVRFANYHGAVKMVKSQLPVWVNEVPGSLKVSETLENGTYRKKISFRLVADISTLRLLERLATEWLIGLYVDGNGRERVCGTVSLPLKLEYTSDVSGYNVQLTGEDTASDGYLMA